MTMYAFLSYATADKLIAAEVAKALHVLGIKTFLAHEDIHVSHEWRSTLLEELGKVDLFVPILSSNYYSSVWCVQESGIAAFRSGVTIVPLSTDGTIPAGFLGAIQSTKIDPNTYISPWSIVPGLMRRDVSSAIDAMINLVALSGSYRGAEHNFQQLLPHLERATEAQKVRLLEVSAKNDQVHHAGLCARDYLPPIMKTHGHLLDPQVREKLGDVLKRYEPVNP